MMEKKLNQLLADLETEYHKLQLFHWYVKGHSFFTVHAKLEEYYDDVRDAVDAVAESILKIGGKPVATQKEFLTLTKIKEPKSDFIQADKLFPVVEKDFIYLLKLVQDVKKTADEESNYLISTLMDDYIEDFSKKIWMLRQGINNKK